MAWTSGSLTRGALAADQGFTTSLATWLADRDRILAEAPMQVEIAEQTTSATAYTSLITFDIEVPDFANGATLKAIIEVKVATGPTGPSASGDVRLYNSTRGVDGTEVTGITDTSYVNSSELSMTITEAEANTRVTFGIKGQINNADNTLYIRNTDGASGGRGRVTFWYEVSGA